MKKSNAHGEKKELSLREIKELMALGLSAPPALGVDDQDDVEWFGVNADRARQEFREETGDTKGQL